VDSELLTAGAVARRLGVAVTTLRSWHLRYGLGPSGHARGKHRRYTPADLTRLELMQRLVAQGVPPKEAARWAVRAPAPAAGPRRDGGPGLGLGRAEAAARGLARAALRLDSETVRRIVADAVRTRGVVDTWDRVLCPVLVALGDRVAHTGRLVEVEHLVSGCVSAVLGAVPRPPATQPVGILLACADEEQHSLPVEALAAALATDGVPCRLLGARVPPAALAAAVRRTGPRAVLLWSHTPDTARPAQVSALLTHARRPTVVAAGGPGWDRTELPPGAVAPATLIDAVNLLTAAVGS
jgi:hypothetical protein